ncbi:MAG TPA: hypothetical protein EYN66_01625 [Myxococcales bacterium]|nr:hypothetical protein [Myxococcales bacterium]
MEPTIGNLVIDKPTGMLGLVVAIDRRPWYTMEVQEVWIVRLVNGCEVRHISTTLHQLEVIK